MIMIKNNIKSRFNKVSREQWIYKTFAYHRDEIDSIWLANHNSTIKEQRSWRGWESYR